MRDRSELLADLLGEAVSRETQARLHVHQQLLQKWNPAINLVSPRSLTTSWERHFLDSAQVFGAVDTKTGQWLDIGSGGGFPGLVCAILAAELRPDLRFTLAESDRRKAAFITTVLRDLGLESRVMASRIETLQAQNAQVISARAVAPLRDLLELAEPHLASSGRCVFPKGKRYEEEIATAKQDWRFNLTIKPSITEKNAAILLLESIERV